jgi:hypothetical protein
LFGFIREEVYNEWKSIVKNLSTWKNSFETKSCSAKVDHLQDTLEEAEYGEDIVLKFPFDEEEDIERPKSKKSSTFVPKKMSKEDKVDTIAKKTKSMEMEQYIASSAAESYWDEVAASPIKENWLLEQCKVFIENNGSHFTVEQLTTNILQALKSPKSGNTFIIEYNVAQ